MSDETVWDDPDIRVGGDYVKFENKGDEVEGVITGITVHTFPDGKKAPQLFLTKDSGDEVTVTAGQIGLKVKLQELRPKTGDRIKIVMLGSERRDGGKTLKHWDVTVTPGTTVPAAASSTAPATSELV